MSQRVDVELLVAAGVASFLDAFFAYCRLLDHLMLISAAGSRLIQALSCSPCACLDELNGPRSNWTLNVFLPVEDGLT